MTDGPPPSIQGDVPTLRLITLRRLLDRASTPLLFDDGAWVGDVASALRDAPHAVALIVDAERTLVGTLRARDLAEVAHDRRAGEVVVRDAPVMEPEEDVEAAKVALATVGTDRVLVVGREGELLGVLTERDLAGANRRRERVRRHRAS